MSTHPETVATSWTTADEDFFRVTRDAFGSEFLAGAGVLLASYDDESAPATVASAPAAPEPATVAAPTPVTT